MDVRVWLWRKLSAKELMLLNCGVEEDSWESLGLKGDQSWTFGSGPPERRSVLSVIERTDVECETLILWLSDAKNWLTGKDPDAGKDWRWEKGMTDSWMASLTRWTWVWVSSGRWWKTGKTHMPQSSVLQSVGHDWATEQHPTLIALSLAYGILECSL